MTPKAKQNLMQLGLTNRDIEAIELLPNFINNNQYILEHEDNSNKVNSKIREEISTSQEFELLHILVNDLFKTLGIQSEELDKYNKIVEEAKKEEK